MRSRRDADVSTTRNKRCAIYTRKSTAHGLEREFTSLDAQREACAAYVERQPGWSLVNERYDDGGFTGATLERPSLQRLVADLEQGKIDVVVVYKVDRLSRSMTDFVRMMDRFAKAGVSFVSVTQNFSTADAIGRLTLNMLMSFAEFEREMISERVRDKIAASRKKGMWGTGSVPFGYRFVDHRLAIDEAEAVVVRRILALYVELRSISAVQRTLNDTDIRTRAQKRWTYDSVKYVLRNPTYAGYVAYGGELHEGEHTAIIDRPIFERVRAIRAAAPDRTKHRGRGARYLLTGLLRCTCVRDDGATCGYAVSPASAHGRSGVYRYYRCMHPRKAGLSCRSRPLPAKALEAYVVDQIRHVASSPALVAEAQDQFKARLQGARTALEEERRALPGRIAGLSDEGQALVARLAAAEDSTARFLEHRIQQIGEEVAQLETRLVATERQLGALANTEADTEWVAAQLTRFERVWHVLRPDLRRRLVRSLIVRIDVNEPDGEIAIEFGGWSASYAEGSGTQGAEEVGTA